VNNEENLYFEINSQGNLLKIETLNQVYENSDLDWDNNWIKCKIYVSGGVFSGNYFAELQTVDFEKFKCDINSLYENLNGVIEFNDLEGYVNIEIKGDGIGHFKCITTCEDFPGINSATLSFEIDFDQTYIKKIVYQLNEITKKFPIKGNYTIQNNYNI
jgi:hypothetical protein